MNDQQLLQLLDKYLRNECTPEEKMLLESWYERYESPLGDTAPDPAPRISAVYDSIAARLREEGEMPALEPAPVRRIAPRWWKAAAAAALILAGTAAFWFTRQPAMLVATAPAGNSSFVELPDGSRVWLNVRSSLEYAGDMRKNGREVFLRGEGYFEVSPNQKQPFIIHTNDLSVQVLGTSFNLKAYDEDAALETTLVDGKIAVALRNQPSQRQLLSPGQKLLLTRKATPGAQGQDWGAFYALLENTPNTIKDTIVNESLWRKGRLQFRDQSFTELAKTMERWYDKRIIIRDASLNDNRFSGEFRKEDITRALKALQLIANFTYDMRGDTVFIQQ